MTNSFICSSELSDSLFTRKEQYLQSHNSQGRSYSICNLPKNRQKILTHNNVHLSIDMELTAENNIPQLSPYNGNLDFEAYRFDEYRRHEGRGAAVHFFMHDYKFYTAITKNLERTTYNLSSYDYVFAPDCSLYVDLGKQINMQAIYDSRFAAAYWQRCGFNVIPVASWGNATSLSYCFEGLPQNSVIAICGIGHDYCSGAKRLWRYAVHQLIAELNPTTLIVYGGNMEDTIDLPIPVKYFTDYIHKKFR